MIKLIKSQFLIFIFLVLGTGCAGHFSNYELSQIFSTKGFNTKQTERGVVVFLPEVFFEFDQANLTTAAHNKLSTIAEVLLDPKTLSRKVLIEGHSDSLGNDLYNTNLSMKRALQVENYLVLKNVDKSRIRSFGYGEKYPVAPNVNLDGTDNPKGRALNRRVEIILKNLNQP